jgi:hypothetical protein
VATGFTGEIIGFDCRNTCDGFQDTLAGLLVKVQAKDTEDSVSSYLKQMMEGVQHQCEAAAERASDTISLYRNPTSESSPNALQSTLQRQKRQLFFGLGLLLGIGIVALGSYLFSQSNLVDMSVAVNSGPTDETIRVLQDHEKRVTVNRAAVDHTKSILSRLEVITAKLHHVTNVLEELLAVHAGLESVIREVDRILDGAAALSHLRFSSKLVAPSKLRGAVRLLKEKLASRNLLILPTQGHEFYDLEASFIYFANDTLRAFLHVPAYYAGSLLDLYEYVPSPIRVTSDRYFLPNPSSRVLAVDTGRATLFRTMSRAELAMCRQSGSKFYCPGQNFYRKEAVEDCLMNLFQNRLDGLAHTCPFTPLKAAEDYLVQLTTNEFLLYHANSNRVSVQCGPTTGLDAETFQGLRKISLPAGCRATTLNFVFDGEIDVMVQDDRLAPHFQHAANLSSFFPPDLLSAEVDELLAETSLIGTEHGVRIKDLVTVLKASRTRFRFHVGIGIFGILIMLLIILFCCYYCCCRKGGKCLPRVSFGDKRRRQRRSGGEYEMTGLGARVSQYASRQSLHTAIPPASAPEYTEEAEGEEDIVSVRRTRLPGTPNPVLRLKRRAKAIHEP